MKKLSDYVEDKLNFDYIVDTIGIGILTLLLFFIILTLPKLFIGFIFGAVGCFMIGLIVRLIRDTIAKNKGKQ